MPASTQPGGGDEHRADADADEVALVDLVRELATAPPGLVEDGPALIGQTSRRDFRLGQMLAGLQGQHVQAAHDLHVLSERETGLDAAAARHVKDLLISWAGSGRTVILTTHILEVAERLAEQVVLAVPEQRLFFQKVFSKPD